MAKTNPNAQPRNQHGRDWGNYAALVDLPNAASWTGADTTALEAGDTAYLTGTGRVYCSAPGTPGLLDAVWSSSGGAGITELDGDVTAGPGSGTQTATVAGLRGMIIDPSITTAADGDVLTFDSFLGWIAAPPTGGGVTIRQAQLNAMMFS